jgi:hypothetical protein
MRICRSGLLIICATFLAACQTEYVPIIPDVPAELRTPVTPPQRQAATLKDVGLIITDYVQSLDEANGKIIATDCILTAAENGVEPQCIAP